MGIIGDVGAIIVGLLLLFSGRRFFWLAAGLVGFLFAYTILDHFFDLWWVNLVVGIVLGAVMAWLARKFIRILSFIIGTMLGTILLPYLFGFFSTDYSWLLVSLIGGVLGAAVVGITMKWGLILITSLLGAAIVSQNVSDIIPLNQTIKSIAALVLLVLGIITQAKMDKNSD